MSTELSFVEAQIDAFVNTMWWSLDQKFGRLIRPRCRENRNILIAAIDQLEQIWDSVATRLTIAFTLPYILQYFDVVENPFRIGMGLVGFSIVWPWVYQIFIYTRFLDPLRHLPAPKVPLL
jgi:hypothetical protein